MWLPIFLPSLNDDKTRKKIFSYTFGPLVMADSYCMTVDTWIHFLPQEIIGCAI